MRKLCSTLVVYFLQFSGSWTRCVKHLICCLSDGNATFYSAVEEAAETSQLIENISDEKATIILWFASSLVEEVGKTDSSSMKQLSLSHTPWDESMLTRKLDTNFTKELHQMPMTLFL